MMSTALLLVDLQYDFIERPGLLPTLEQLTPPVESVLKFARRRGLQVIHVRTLISPSGKNRMPHWKTNEVWQCIAGTRGSDSPAELCPRPGEVVVHKQFFSAFSNPQLEKILESAGIDELWVTGLYTHSCVRSTVMDAYERGYRVRLIEDCLGSTDPLHARLSLDYMVGRAASLTTSSNLVGTGCETLIHYSPTKPAEVVAAVKPDTVKRISSVSLRAHKAALNWQLQSVEFRRQCIRAFRERLAASRRELEALIISDLGKPRSAATDELERSLGHIDEALKLEPQVPIGPGVNVIYEPHGAVAIITPWNNPVAIAVGKLCAALLLGNSVVWKPAFQAHNISRRVVALAHAAGLPANLLQVVEGGPAQVAALAQDPNIAAVSLTGSEQAGRAIEPICHITGKPLQAELGGNNALLVMADSDIAGLAPTWTRLAFGFAGQRCTAIRRFVVERSVTNTFEMHMRKAVEELALSHPSHESSVVGPLISARQLQRVRHAVAAAVARGARVVATAGAPAHITGHYYPATLLANLPTEDPLVQEELFGPVALILPVDDFEHGVELVNGVRQGLLAGLASDSEELQERFVRACETGIAVDGHGMPLHPGAPFGGRKTSQMGPPEHGIWDRQFFGRVKARYRRETK